MEKGEGKMEKGKMEKGEGKRYERKLCRKIELSK